MLKKKVIILFFPQFIEKFRKFSDSIYPENLSKEEKQKGFLLLSRKKINEDNKPFDNKIDEELKNHPKMNFDISYIENPNSEFVNNYFKSKFFDFHNFVLVNYPKNTKKLLEMMENNDENFPLDFEIIFLNMDKETIEEIINHPNKFISSNEELSKFDREISDYLDIKEIIDNFVDLDDGNASKVSIINMKKDDLLSGEIIMKIWSELLKRR